MPTKFHQNPSSGYGEVVENVKVYGRGRTPTDGRRTMRYDNSSLEPSAQVSLKDTLFANFDQIAFIKLLVVKNRYNVTCILSSSFLLAEAFWKWTIDMM